MVKVCQYRLTMPVAPIAACSQRTQDISTRLGSECLLLNVVIRSCYRRTIGCRIVTYRRTMDWRGAIRGAHFRGIEAEVARGTIGT